MEEETSKNDDLVNLCEPRMEPVRFKQVPWEVLERCSVPGEILYRKVFQHGELPVKPQMNSRPDPKY
jgi:hypothetical protein